MEVALALPMKDPLTNELWLMLNDCTDTQFFDLKQAKAELALLKLSTLSVFDLKTVAASIVQLQKYRIRD